jgi:hypothetical protein
VTDRVWRVVSSRGSRRVLVTKELPGDYWLRLLTGADRRTEIAQGDDILAVGHDNVVVPHLGSASTSIVNADDLGLPRLAAGPQIKEDLQ